MRVRRDWDYRRRGGAGQEMAGFNRGKARPKGPPSPAPDAFADYIKFDDLFGASSIFTTGTVRQRRRETEVFVKDTLERRTYG